MRTLEDMVRALPPDLHQEVEDFVHFLIEKRSRRRKTHPKLDWRGALRELRGQYTSAQLQHESLEWWRG